MADLLSSSSMKYMYLSKYQLGNARPINERRVNSSIYLINIILIAEVAYWGACLQVPTYQISIKPKA